MYVCVAVLNVLLSLQQPGPRSCSRNACGTEPSRGFTYPVLVLPLQQHPWQLGFSPRSRFVAQSQTRGTATRRALQGMHAKTT